MKKLFVISILMLISFFLIKSLSMELGKDECGWDASAIRGTLYDISTYRSCIISLKGLRELTGSFRKSPWIENHKVSNITSIGGLQV